MVQRLIGRLSLVGTKAGNTATRRGTEWYICVRYSPAHRETRGKLTIYCMGAETLQKRLWEDMRISVTTEEADAYLEGFFKTYPGVRQYILATQKFVARYKFTYTYTGHRRRFPIAMYNTRQINRVSRQAVNSRIQTTSAVLVNSNMIDAHKEIKKLGGRLILTVHDSIGFQLPKGTPGVKALLDDIVITRTREKYPWLPVPWKYDVGMGPSYGEAHDPVV